ncbi:uncharacterized protein BCR38DRAFT_99775 [Pseudomassariella vexata]|uniref:Uncharacterized protein n=1 Tax=Pseudomassariella vexata TaxID=1141098 RepID=A0A1Y2EFM1_9PEZI|nr:uncharacterized protein BCR38DRAFT_99775 [Pseudomassariella vexata]ORY70104.1 hypothetical protein BCR38DRAFT_99775 [Pseudomassariella vexata]
MMGTHEPVEPSSSRPKLTQAQTSNPTRSGGKYVLIPLLLALSAFGFYTTVISMTTNGLVDVLHAVASGEQSSLVGAPEPFKRVYTGIALLDGHLALLVGFFSPFVDGAVPGEATLFYFWAMAQFLASWTVVTLEGVRVGNRSGFSSWTATFGILVQNLAWATTLPVWLAVHLLTSPVAQLPKGDGNAARKALSAYLWDMALLPSAVMLGAIAPALLMSWPTLLGQSASAHYGWIAFWQFFPVWTAGLQWVLRMVCYNTVGSIKPKDDEGRPTSPGKGYMAAVGSVYRFALTLLVGVHLPILGLAVAPAAAHSYLGTKFSGYAGIFERGTFTNVFVSHPPSQPPTVIPTGYASGDLSPLSMHFLQYNLYVASIPFLLWAIYLHQITLKKSNVVGILKTVGFWTLVGGPTAAVVALLWERDEVVLEGEEFDKKTN